MHHQKIAWGFKRLCAPIPSGDLTKMWLLAENLKNQAKNGHNTKTEQYRGKTGYFC